MLKLGIEDSRSKKKFSKEYAMTEKNRLPVKTAQTLDPDARYINAMLDDVSRMVSVGQALKEIIRQRFSDDLKGFRRWVRMNVDKDEKSILRYLSLAEHTDFLAVRGTIRLSDAYALLGLDCNVSVEKCWKMPVEDLH